MRDCLDPCLEHDFPISEFEIICVDDGSTDGSLTILREYETKFPNVHVVVFPKSKGADGARNAVLDQLQGNWYLFLAATIFWQTAVFQEERSQRKGEFVGALEPQHPRAKAFAF